MTEEVRANPHARIRVRDPGEFVVEAPHQNKRTVIKGAPLLAVLNEASEWTPVERLRSLLNDAVGPQVAEEVLDRFRANHLLLDRSSTGQQGEETPDRWAKFGWESAWEYHAYTRDFPFTEWGDQGDWKETLDERSGASVFKRYGRRETRDLPSVKNASPLADVQDAVGLDYRSAVRSSDQIGTAELAPILWYAFAPTSMRDIANGDKIQQRTSPSGGGRHPTEVYPILRHVDDVESGVYHYSPADHELEVLETAVEGADDLTTLLSVDADDWAAALVLTARVARTMAKYRNSRAYRIVHQDVGHLVGTLKMLAKAAGLTATFEWVAETRRIEDLLEIDPLSEPVFGHVTLRPSAGSSVID